jgi:hypothetical protein
MLARGTVINMTLIYLGLTFRNKGSELPVLGAPDRASLRQDI